MKHSFFVLFIVIGLWSCENKEETDIEKPAVEFVFPMNCDTLIIGEEFLLKVQLNDNAALASFQVSVHHNFDQHGHSTEVESCPLEDKKDFVDPWEIKQNFTVTDREREFLAEELIYIPEGVDQGDYHFQVTVVDAQGWSSFKILSVKLQARD